MSDYRDLHRLTLADLQRILNGSSKFGTVVPSVDKMRKLHARAGIRVGAPREVSFFKFLAWLCDEVHRKRDALAGADREDDYDKAEAEARYRSFKAKLAEIEYLKQSGQYVPVADRDALLAGRALEFRRGLETALLHRLPPRLATLDDPAEIAEVLEGVIRELLEKYTRPCS